MEEKEEEHASGNQPGESVQRPDMIYTTGFLDTVNAIPGVESLSSWLFRTPGTSWDSMLIAFVLVAAMALASAQSWGTPQYYLPESMHRLAEIFTPTPRIPQFILDTQHPWLKGDGKWIQTLPNATELLCSMDSIYRPSNYDSEKTYPSDLFKHLRIDNNREGSGRRGWRNAELRLREMLQCPAALQDVESFDLQVYISDGRYVGWWESPNPPAHLPGLFIEALKSMPNLQELQWNTFWNGNDAFRKAFQEANLTLPSVRRLIPAEYCDFLVPMCPAVESLQSGYAVRTYSRWSGAGPNAPDGCLELIRLAASAKNLTSFSVYTDWEPKHLQAMAREIPQITDLHIQGELSRWAWEPTLEPGQRPDGMARFERFVDMLVKFTHLRHLKLPGAWALRLDNSFEPAGCGNAYDGRGGRAYGRYESEWIANMTEEAANVLLPKLPNLKSLSFGGSCAELNRTADGQFTTTWPWTDRMTEWTFEVWPEVGTENYTVAELKDLQDSIINRDWIGPGPEGDEDEYLLNTADELGN